MRQRTAAFLSAITLALVSSSVLAAPVPSGAASGIDQRDSAVFQPIRVPGTILEPDPDPEITGIVTVPDPSTDPSIGSAVPPPQPSSPPLELTPNGHDGNRSTCDGLICNPIGRRDEPAPLILISLPKTGGVDQRDTETEQAAPILEFPPNFGFTSENPGTPPPQPSFAPTDGSASPPPPPSPSATPTDGSTPPPQPPFPSVIPAGGLPPPPQPSSPPLELIPNGDGVDGNPTCGGARCDSLGRRDEPAPLILISRPKTGGVDQRDTPRSDEFVREPEPLILISRPKTGGVDQRDTEQTHAKEPASFAGAFVPHPKAIGQRDTPEFTPLTGLPPLTQSFTPIIPTGVPFDPSAPPPSPSSPPGELVANGKDSEGNPTCDDLICNPLGRRDEPEPLILISRPKTGGVDQRDTEELD